MRYDDDLPQWIRDLKVGDRVCNCRYEHLTIQSIEDEAWPVRAPHWLEALTDMLPSAIRTWIWRAIEWVQWSMDHVVITDRLLKLSDGSEYYAKPCCSPDGHAPYEEPCKR
jgi:hypothetical protein